MRQLESENNKLLNLLDIKDEQMEMLSKVESVNHNPISTSPKSQAAQVVTSTTASTTAAVAAVKKAPSIHDDEDEEEAYVVHQINTLSEQGTYKGSAAGGVFIEAFLENSSRKTPPSLHSSLNYLRMSTHPHIPLLYRLLQIPSQRRPPWLLPSHLLILFQPSFPRCPSPIA